MPSSIDCQLPSPQQIIKEQIIEGNQIKFELDLKNLNLQLNTETEPSPAMREIGPVKIGSQIIGSDHFNDYDIRVNQYGTASIQTMNSQSPKDAKEVLSLFLKDQTMMVQKRNIKFKDEVVKPAKVKVVRELMKYSPIKELRYKTNNEILSAEKKGEHHYEFFNETYQWQMRAFRNKFFKSVNEIDKKKIHRTMVELMYTQLIDHMNKDSDDMIPKLYRENHLRWCNLLMKNPNIQQFSINMTNQLQEIFNKEMINNKDIFDLYMSQPRPQMPNTARCQTQRYKSRDEELQHMLYPTIRNERQVFQREQKVEKEIRQAAAKFNYLEMLRSQKKRKTELVGMQKHLNQRGKTVAQAAREAQEDKNLLKKQQEQDLVGIYKAKQKSKKIMSQKNQGNVLSEFQKDLLKKTEEINELIQSVDENNTDLRNDVEDTKKALEDLENERVPGTHHIIPGVKIHDLMDAWGKEDVWYDEDIAKWASELWMSLQEFEQHIRDEERGFKMVHEKLMRQFTGQLNRYKSVTSAKIEELESALIETKLKLMREREQAEMKIAEFESSLLNMQPDQKQVDELVEKCQSGLVIKNMQEARNIIKKFVTVVKKKEHQIDSLNLKINMNMKTIESLMQKVDIKKTYYNEESKLRKFYQSILLKMVRDIKLFQDDEQKQEQLQSIFEQEDDLNYQRHIFFILDNIDLKSAINAHVNKYFGMIEGLNKIENNLNLLELVQGGEKTPAKLSHSSSGRSGSRTGNRSHHVRRPMKTKTLIGKKQSSNISGKAFKKPKRKPSNTTTELSGANTHIRPVSRAESIGSGGTSMRSRKGKRGRPQSNQYSSQNEKAEAEFANAAREAAKKAMMSMIRDALDGKLDHLVATEKSGACEVDYTEARQKMTEVIRSIKPEELENNAFLNAKGDDDDSENGKKKKKKAIRKKTEAMKKKQTTKDVLPGEATKKSLAKKAKLLKDLEMKQSEINLDQSARVNTGLGDLITGMSGSGENLAQGSGEGLNAANVSGQILQEQSSFKQMNSIRQRQMYAANKKLSIVQEKYENLKIFKRSSSEGGSGSVSSESISVGSDRGEQPNQVARELTNQSRNSPRKKQAQKNLKITSTKNVLNGLGNLKNMGGQMSHTSDKSQTDLSHVGGQITRRLDSNASRAQMSHLMKKDTVNLGLDSKATRTSKKSQFAMIKKRKKETLEGVFLAQRELGKLVNEKYQEQETEFTEFKLNNKQRFMMGANQLKELLDQVQIAMNHQLEKEEFEKMQKPDVGEFFAELNKVIEKQYEFGIINQQMENGCVGLVLQDDYKADKEREEKLKKVCYGDIMQPVISDTGELLGFQLRANLIPMMFMGNKFDFLQLKRLIKTCMYCNRIIRGGQEFDFNVKQVNGEKKIEITQLDFKEIEIQVCEADIIEEMKALKTEDSDEDQNSSESEIVAADRLCLGILKSHMIDVIARLNPSKKTYYKMVWEQMDFEMLFDQGLENVFEDAKTEKAHQEIKFGRYLQVIMDNVLRKVHKIEKKYDKEKLKVDKLFADPPKQVITQVISNEDKISKFVQASVETHDTETNTSEFNIKGLGQKISKADGTIMKKSKNQLILDQALEDEFKKTLKLFDDFVDYLSKIDDRLLVAMKPIDVTQNKEIQVNELQAETTVETKNQKEPQQIKVMIKVKDEEIDVTTMTKMREKLQSSLYALKEDSIKYKRGGLRLANSQYRRDSNNVSPRQMNLDLIQQLNDQMVNNQQNSRLQTQNNSPRAVMSPPTQKPKQQPFKGLTSNQNRRQQTAIEIKKRANQKNLKDLVIADDDIHFGLLPDSLQKEIRTTLQSPQTGRKIQPSEKTSTKLREFNKSTDLDSQTQHQLASINKKVLQTIDYQSSNNYKETSEGNITQLTHHNPGIRNHPQNVYLKQLTRNLQSANSQYDKEDFPRIVNTSLDISTSGNTRNFIQTSRRGLFSQQNSQECSPKGVPMEILNSALKGSRDFKWTNKDIQSQYEKLTREQKVRPTYIKGKINQMFNEQEANKTTKWQKISQKYEQDSLLSSNKPDTARKPQSILSPPTLDHGNRQHISNMAKSVNYSLLSPSFEKHEKRKSFMQPKLNVQTIQHFNEFKEITTGVRKQIIDVVVSDQTSKRKLNRLQTIENPTLSNDNPQSRCGDAEQSSNRLSPIDKQNNESLEQIIVISKPASPSGIIVNTRGQKNQRLEVNTDDSQKIMEEYGSNVSSPKTNYRKNKIRSKADYQSVHTLGDMYQ